MVSLTPSCVVPSQKMVSAFISSATAPMARLTPEETMPCTQSTLSCSTSLRSRSMESLGLVSSSITSSTLRPAIPPAALMRSTANSVPRSPHSPMVPMMPDLGVMMPIFSGRFCAIAGKLRYGCVASAAPAPPRTLSTFLRLLCMVFLQVWSCVLRLGRALQRVFSFIGWQVGRGGRRAQSGAVEVEDIAQRTAVDPPRGNLFVHRQCGRMADGVTVGKALRGNARRGHGLVLRRQAPASREQRLAVLRHEALVGYFVAVVDEPGEPGLGARVHFDRPRGARDAGRELGAPNHVGVGKRGYAIDLAGLAHADLHARVVDPALFAAGQVVAEESRVFRNLLATF